MKKTLFSTIVLFMIVVGLASCGTYTTNNQGDQSFGKYNIFAFTPQYDSKELTSIGKTTIDVTITNNGEIRIRGIYADICFYDDNGNIVGTDSRMLQVGLAPGQSVIQEYWSETDFSSCEITSYGYYPVDESIVPGNDNNRIDVDLFAKHIRFFGSTF